MLSGLFDTIGSRPLGLARVIIGVAAIIRAFISLPELLQLTDEVTMRAPYLQWTPEPTLPLVITVITIWVVAGILFTLGWKVPLIGPVLLLTVVFVISLDEQIYANHLYLLAWLVLLLTLAGAGSGLTVTRSDEPVIRWPVLLLMAQLSIVYGFSALTKLNESFLSGRVLAGTLGSGLVGFPEALRTPRFLSLVATAAVIAELFIAVFIWRKRFRPAAFILGLGLHLSIVLLMAGTAKLLVFALEMLALYPLFLSKDRLVLIWDDSCGYCRDWVRRFQRLDTLRLLEPIGASDPRNPVDATDVARAMHLIHDGETTRGFKAVSRTLENLVPTLWVAPLLRLPGVTHLGGLWYRRQALRRSCLVGTGMAEEISPDSTGR